MMFRTLMISSLFFLAACSPSSSVDHLLGADVETIPEIGNSALAGPSEPIRAIVNDRRQSLRARLGAAFRQHKTRI